MPVDLLAPLSLELPLQPRHGLLLGLLGNAPLRPLRLDPLPQELDLVPVVGLDRVPHQTVLLTLTLLRFLVLAFLLKEFVLFEVARQFVDLLAKLDLECIPLVVEGALVLHEVLLEAAVADSLNTRLALFTSLCLAGLFLPTSLLGLHLVLILPEKSLEFLLLPQNSTVCLLSLEGGAWDSLLDRGAERGQAVLGPADVVHEDLINTLIGRRLRCLFSRHSLLKDQLQL